LSSFFLLINVTIGRMRPTMFRTALISMFLTSAAIADTWTVDDDGKADFDNIQAAIDAASDGDEIIVMTGTYTSTQAGHVVNMLGKAVTLRSSDPSDPDVVAATIIDGEGARRGFACFNNETNKTMIVGLTIAGGYSVDYDYDGDGNLTLWENAGGGMYNYESSPTLNGCTFNSNTSDDEAGGMFNYSSSPVLTTCTFTNNTSTQDGGGMYNHSSSPTLTNCTFDGNNAADKGGGMRNYSSSPTLADCAFTGNTASFGSGIHNASSSPAIENCTFTNNTSTQDGGGMYNHSECTTIAAAPR